MRQKKNVNIEISEYLKIFMLHKNLLNGKRSVCEVKGLPGKLGTNGYTKI